MALGVMTKGPITPMVMGLCALCLSAATGRWRWLGGTRPGLGLAILLVVVAPWVIAVGEAIGWERYAQTVLGETLGRSASAREGHFGPPGYHAVFAIVLLWPGSMLIGLALPRAWGKARGSARGAAGTASAHSGRFRGRDAELFLLCWIAPSWLVLELVMTKLPHYTMPLYPALALLCARAVFAAQSGRRAGLNRRLDRAGLVGFGVLSAALALAAAAGDFAAQGVDSIGAVYSAAALGLVAFGLIVKWAIEIRRGRWALGQLTLVACAAWLGVYVIGLVLPQWDHLWVSRALAGRLAGATEPIAAIDYHEDSLVFLLRGRMDRIDAAALEAWLAAHPDGVVVAPADLTRGDGRFETVGAAQGFNYAQGRPVDLVIVRRGPRD
jgi:4-amino-4-deoxy-L-arabinose transferase-like glycosyltransferase